MDKLGIGFQLYRYKGLEKQKVYDFHESPGNINTGLTLLELNVMGGMEKKTSEITKELRKRLDNR